MKSNLEYLKEAIAAGTDTSEWLEAVKDELTESKDKITDQSDEVSRLETTVEQLEYALDSNEGFTVIDFGFDKLWWKSGNLKIQDIMEDLNKKYGIGEMKEA